MEKERLKFSIERFDHYYDSVNNKSNIILGFCTLFFGALIAIHPKIITIPGINNTIMVNYAILISLSYTSMVLLIITSIPYLNSNGKSVHFFQSITSMGKSTFMEKSEKMNELDELKDLRKQVYHLASGLTKKFKRLKIALTILVIQLIFSIPFIILIINLKK